MIDLNLIYTFLEVARLKNLHLVAQRFSITQPALSQRIKSLEEQIGKSLFLRKQSMELNDTGRELYELCKNYMEDIKAIDNWVAAQKDMVEGSISITTPYGPVSYIFPDFLGGFLQKYPSAEISCRSVETSPLVEDLVLSGKSDLGVIVGKCKKSSLKVQRLLLNNSVFMVCSLNHPLANKPAVTKKDLRGVRLILHSDRQSRTMKKILKLTGLSQDRNLNILRLPDMESCKKHVVNGLGVSFIAKMYILNELKEGKLKVLPSFELTSPLQLISLKNKFESPLVSKFKTEFVNYCHRLDQQLAS